jgi:hypothetical protein
MSESLNPYATPRAVVADEGVGSQAEAVREEHIEHEASVKSAGVLFILGGLFSLVAASGMIVSSAAVAEDRPGFLVLSVMVALLAVTYIAMGWGLRMLRTWARRPAVGLAVIGLLGFPIGTLINAYILWLLLAAKGRRVLAADYAAIVKATPHVRYRAPLWIWIVLGAIVLAIVFVVVAGLPSR